MNFFNNYRNIINNSFQDQNVYKKIISEKGLSEIKYINYTNDFKEQPFCPITQKKFKDNILVAKLPCNHIFEPSGILFWLKNNNSSCPVCRHQMDYIEIKNNVDISANHNNTYSNNFNNINPINDVFQYTFDINSQNIPYNFNIRYNILNLDLSGENVSDLSGEEILIFNNNTDLSNNNTDLSNNNTDLSNNYNTDLSNNNNNNIDLSNNIYSSVYNNTLFTRIENEIVNTLTNLYYRRQEERDLEMALMNSLQDN